MQNIVSVAILLYPTLCAISSFKISEQMQSDTVLAVVVFHCTEEIYWCFLERPEHIVAYDFFMGNASVYLSKRLVAARGQNIDDGSLLPVTAPAVDVQCMPGMTCKRIFTVQVYLTETLVCLMMIQYFRVRSLPRLQILMMICFPKNMAGGLVVVLPFRLFIVELPSGPYTDIHSLCQAGS